MKNVKYVQLKNFLDNMNWFLDKKKFHAKNSLKIGKERMEYMRPEKRKEFLKKLSNYKNIASQLNFESLQNSQKNKKKSNQDSKNYKNKKYLKHSFSLNRSNEMNYNLLGRKLSKKQNSNIKYNIGNDKFQKGKSSFSKKKSSLSPGSQKHKKIFNGNSHLPPIRGTKELEQESKKFSNNIYKGNYKSRNREDNYIPYTIKDYNKIKLGKYLTLGGLGPNIGNEDWIIKREKSDKMKSYSIRNIPKIKVNPAEEITKTFSVMENKIIDQKVLKNKAKDYSIMAQILALKSFSKPLHPINPLSKIEKIKSLLSI